MKVILTNSNLVFRKVKDYVDINLAYWSMNANTGAMESTTYDNQYAKIGPVRKLSVAEDGVQILPNLGSVTSANSSIVYLYDSNMNYIGYGYTKITNGQTIDNILQAPDDYSNQSGAIDKETAIANAAYYMVGMPKQENFASLTGKTFKVR